MAGLQTIIDNANGLLINRRKLVGIQYTRNEIPRVSVTPTKNPWRFNLTMPSSLRYNQARSLLEALDTLDAVFPEVVTFSNNPCLSWIFRYQGSMTTSQINSLRVTSFIGNLLVLNTLPIIPSTRVLFEPNDLIQIGNNPFPFTVVSQVLRGTGATVTVTTNRPNIITSSVGSSPITVGNACQFKMFCPNMPVYKLIPGGAVYNNNTVINNALIEFSSDFELFEYVGDA